MKALINILTAAFVAKDLFKSKSSDVSNKSSGVIGKAFVTIGIAYLANKVLVNAFKFNTESEIGIDPAATFASRLHDAFDPYGLFGAGTDENECYKIAGEIKAAKVWPATQSAYQTLYQRSLGDALISEGIFDKFMAILAGTASPTNTPPIKPKSPTETGKSQIQIFDTVYTYPGWNLRNVFTGNVSKKSVAGQKFNVISFKKETIAGTTGYFVIIEDLVSFSGTYKIFINGLYKK